jgi:subtilase family serine protease
VVKELIASGSETPAYVAAFDEVFLEMAAQGESAFDASGDEAAYDDYDEFGTTGLSVDTDSDSPYITAAGGTTLPFTGTLSSPDGTVTAPITSGHSERAWGWDYTWAPEAKVLAEPLATVAEDPDIGVGGDGGGFSLDEAQPSYQRGVPGTNAFSAVKYFTSTDVQDIGGGVFEPTGFAFNPDPPVIHGFGTGRATPDVSTDADPLSGFLLYEPSFAGVSQPVLQPDWGGTSFVSPAQRLDGRDRLLCWAPCGAMEPVDLSVRNATQLAVRSAQRHRDQQRQPVLHRQPGHGVQPELWPGCARLHPAGQRVRRSALRGPTRSFSRRLRR